MLAGRCTDDDLADEAHAVVRATWAEQIEHAITGLDITDELDRLATNVRERAFTPREFTD